MSIAEAIAAAWTAPAIDQYAAKKKNPDLGQPSLFETSHQPHLEGLGPGRWITIHSEKDAAGGSHGGHHVFVGDDGKMKTGNFAGQTMGQAFGEKRKKPDYDKRLEDQQKRRDPDGKSTEPVDRANREFIPLRERRKVAEELAQAGKTQQEIADYLASKKVALVDARKLASDAVDKFPPKPIKAKVGDNGKADDLLDDWSSSEEFEHVMNASPRLKALDKAAAQEIEERLTGSDGTPSIGPKEKAYLNAMATAMEEAGHEVPEDIKRRIGYNSPKPGIIPGSTAVKNEDAKPGDQMGLFGEGEKAKAKPWKPSLLDTKGKQAVLFDTKGDKDQKVLFGDGVTPSDMVYQPDAPSTPSEKAAAAFDAATDSGKSPRETAAAAQKQLDADYEFARASEVRNAGEDLKGSARHKVNEWKGLDEAEKDGTAAAMVTRDQLAKLEPHNFMVTVDKNPMTSLAMHYAMRAFPAKPGAKSGSAKENREQYLEAYRSVKAKAEELAQSHDDTKALEAVRDLQTHVRSMIDKLRVSDRYNQTANDLVGLHKALASGWRAPKNGTVAKLNEFANEVQNKYGKTFASLSDSGTLADKKEALSQAAEHAKDIIEGHSLNKTFGKESKVVKRFNPADRYVKKAIRKGGRDVSAVTSDPNKATKHMVESFGLRGVQWGNTVTDEERKHHAGKAVEALTDLADTVGLHPKDIALDGKLGLAIGARGKGTASAHYEPDTQVINLTRASGVGTLAHEWGHGFDHMLEKFGISGGSGQYMSENHHYTHELVNHKGERHAAWRANEKDPVRSGWSKRELPMVGVRKAYQEWHEASKPFRDRLKGELREMVRNKQLSQKKADDYWASGREVFARTFEQHVQHKLQSEGRDNTYLTGLSSGGGLWPTSEESKAMAPAFDKIFEEYRKHKHGSPDKVKFSRREADAAFRPLLIDRYTDIPEGKRWVTIGAEVGEDGEKHGGHPVLIKAENGEIQSGHFEGKTLKQAFGNSASPDNKKKTPNQTSAADDLEQAEDSTANETLEQKILGKRAGSAKVVSALMQESLRKHGSTSLLGHTVNSAEDLATVAQVYRDSRYETFRAFLVKDGKIIAHNAYSSRAPGLVMIPAHVTEHLARDMAATGADGYYLMHNHPSGDPTPSLPDREVTKRFAQVVPGMIDHVIINHTKGAIINAQGESRGYSLENENLNDLSRAKGATEYLDQFINSPESLGQLAKKLEPKQSGRAVMIFCNVKLKTRMVLDLDSSNLKDRGRKNFQIAGAIRRASRHVASTERFLVLGEGEKYDDYAHLIENGLVRDIVAPSQSDSALLKGFHQKSNRLEQGLRGGVVAREKFSNYSSQKLGEDIARAWIERYWQRADDGDLCLHDSPTVDRYDWNAELHPRHQAGSPGGVGGEFAARIGGGGTRGNRVATGQVPPRKSSVKRELPEMPRIDRSHALHRSQLGPQLDRKLLDWSYRMDGILSPMNKMPTNPKSAADQAEDGWQYVDKNKVRSLLEEMNQMDRDARAQGIPLSDYVNASQLIDRRLAVRLDGGERFFNLEKLGNKIKRGRNASTLQEAPKQDSIRDAVAKAMGLRSGGTPSGEASEPANAQSAESPSLPPKKISSGLSKQGENKLNGIVNEVVGDGDKAKKEHFRQVALDAWKQMKTHAEEHNDALRQITSFFGKNHGALAANISKGLDPTRLRGFDELVDHAAREFPHIVSHFRGESGSGSAEDGLIKALREGIRNVPQPWDDDVIDRAMQMVGPGFFEEYQPEAADAEDWEAIPFSIRTDIRRMVQRYWFNSENPIRAKATLIA